jgi:predicted HTH domain antitoxin
MPVIDIDIPQDVLELLKRSKVGSFPLAEHVRIALAAQLFLEGVISIGRAAEISHQNRHDMEVLLPTIGVPVVRYDLADYERELAAAEDLSKPQE